VLISEYIFSQYQYFEVKDGDTINVVDKNGLKQGIWRTYWSNGDLRSETFYIDNKKNGLEITFYDYPDCPEKEAFYKNDSLDGAVIYYSKRCKKNFEEHYVNGIKEGWEIEYYDNGMKKAEGYFKKGNLDGFYKVYDRKGRFAYETRIVTTDYNLEPNIKDTSENIVYKVQRRNKNKWEKQLIVMDITGSMYPYAQQVSTWLQLHFNSDSTQQYFVFFNDGDRKSDAEKKIGATGGTYFTAAKKVDDIIRTMNLAIKNGEGGDAQENVIEAILYGLKKVKNIQHVILIADNWAPVRDINLLPKVKVPVHVILCGVSNGMKINADYLNIAYKTKGSIHTIEEDIDMAIQEKNKEFFINGNTYKLYNGKFK
jgi:antitoxin component YwqK of YwqJK toxin-antitoxin module